MYLEGKEPLFRKRRHRSNIYHVLILVVLIVFFGTLLTGLVKGDVDPLFMPTPTPTRSTHSFVVEGQTHFAAGDLDSAIAAFEKATAMDPEDY